MGDGDTPIFITLSILMILLGVLLPIVQQAIDGGSVPQNNVNALQGNDTNFITGVITFLGFVGSVFFWYFPTLPFIIGLIKIIITIAWWYMLVRLIRGV